MSLPGSTNLSTAPPKDKAAMSHRAKALLYIAAHKRAPRDVRQGRLIQQRIGDRVLAGFTEWVLAIDTAATRRCAASIAHCPNTLCAGAANKSEPQKSDSKQRQR